MGREVRRVPANWQHPKDARGRYIPLYDHFNEKLASWNKGRLDWARGKKPEFAISETWEEYAGPCPVESEYMPDWTDSERTHYQMYEDTSEGTPISPVMDSPEALARWLADTGASSFGRYTATYEQWLNVCRGGFAPSMVIVVNAEGARLVSGVEAMADGKEGAA